MLSKEEHANIQNTWDKSVDIELGRTRWWNSQTIKDHIFKKVIGENPPQNSNDWRVYSLKKLNRKFKSAISIGCGSAYKELELLKENIVDHFYLFELSAKRLESAKQSAKKHGLSDRITCYYGDFFASEYNMSQKYDLVFWSSSLHHMLDTNLALLSSYDILKDDGYILIDDYIGKNRFQFSDEELQLINQLRNNLPDSIYDHPSLPVIMTREVKRPTIEEMIKIDISEAADSENIIPSLKKIFPHANIIPYGGLLYHFGLNNILINIPENSQLLHSILALDDLTIKKDLSHYAFVLTSKNAK